MKTSLIVGVVALVGIVVAGAVILSRDLTPGAQAIVIQGMFTGVFAVITGLMSSVKADQAAVKADAAATKTAEMHHDLQNGLIPEKVEEAINKMASDPNQPAITINSDEAASKFDSDDRSAVGDGGWSTKVVKDQ